MAKKRRRGLNAADTKLARQRAKVRFGGERSTINALIGQAQSDYASDLTSADAAAKSAIHFANKARVPVRQVFEAAKSQADAARSDVEAAFGRVGAGADPFRAATAREQAGAAQRTALAGANALHELTQRKLEAQAGRQYARTQATSDYRKNLGDLATRLRDLGDREGAFIVAEAGGLKQARAGRKATTRVERLRQRGRERESATEFERKKELERLKADLRPASGGGGRGLPSGVKPASRSDLRMFRADFSKALQVAKQYAASGKISRAQAKANLTSGVVPTQKGERAVPSIDDQLALSVALDVAYKKHVSRGNARRMKRDVGLRVADIPGLTSYSDYQRRTHSKGRYGPNA